MRLIDADKLLARYKERLCAGCKKTKNYCEHCCDIPDVIDDIEDAPTVDAVEPKKGWIPCSKRLPENTEPVNITWVNHKPVSYYADIKDQPYTGTGIYCNGKWWWYSVTCQDYLDEYGKSPGDDMDEAIEVLAWMPLPEPYQSNVEEKTDEN